MFGIIIKYKIIKTLKILLFKKKVVVLLCILFEINYKLL
jgi:hypothetical protein